MGINYSAATGPGSAFAVVSQAPLSAGWHEEDQVMSTQQVQHVTGEGHQGFQKPLNVWKGHYTHLHFARERESLISSQADKPALCSTFKAICHTVMFEKMWATGSGCLQSQGRRKQDRGERGASQQHTADTARVSEWRVTRWVRHSYCPSSWMTGWGHSTGEAPAQEHRARRCLCWAHSRPKACTRLRKWGPPDL